MRRIIALAATVAALAACAKNEVVLTPSSETSEITFNVAPKTKTLGEHQQDFSTANYFASWAYYLDKDKTWAENSSEAADYISRATISYDEENKVWKDKEHSYFWPKTGSLTFFAYSLNKNDIDLQEPTSSFNCTSDAGINGKIHLEMNKNTDFLVADIAQDKTKNESTYSFNGVPTLFRHRLSSVAFTAVKAEDYKNKKFYLQRIAFENVYRAGYYRQLPNECWEVRDGKSKETYFSGASLESSLEVIALDKNDKNAAVSGDVTIYIPQSFKENADAKLVVLYKILTTVNTSTTPHQTVEEVTYEVPVKDIFESWEMGKKYTFNLKFSLDKITWDPVEEDWDPKTEADIDLGA